MTDTPDPITAVMALNGWTDLWYANPFHERTRLRPGVTIGELWAERGWICPSDLAPRDAQRNFGPRWHVGVWTGPDRDLVCLKACATSDEAERWLSPGGWTPEDAVERAVARVEEIRKVTRTP